MISVLIVDDHSMVAEANASYLSSVSGFACVGTAAGVTEAQNILSTTPVDLVLLDIFMPGMSGIELLEKLRQSAHSVDVIVISAANDMNNITTALRLGAVDYLIKPFEFERFHAALRNYQTAHSVMSEKSGLCQAELDAILLRPDCLSMLPDLPKGLTPETLKSVVLDIYRFGTDAFTTEMLSQQLGLSRVTIAKYLRFLTDVGFVNSKMQYRTVGRPVYQYSLNAKRTDVVENFIQMRC